jgi:hypothetical protein
MIWPIVTVAEPPLLVMMPLYTTYWRVKTSGPKGRSPGSAA